MMDFFENLRTTKEVKNTFMKPGNIEMTVEASIYELTTPEVQGLSKGGVSKKDIAQLENGNATDSILSKVAKSMNLIFKTAIKKMKFHIKDGKSFEATTEAELLYAFSNLSVAETTWLRKEIEEVNPCLKGKKAGLEVKKN